MIHDMTLLQKSSFFANLSFSCYDNEGAMRLKFKKTFPTINFITHEGSDVYILENDADVIVVCRGTEVKQWSDISADASISRKKLTYGKVHIGFQHYVDKVWADIVARSENWNNKNVWFTGHSLGAAMATIMACRFGSDNKFPVPAGLFTYGSPRVGDRKFANHMNALPFEHHRWVNNGDIITKIPLVPWFYHCGKMHFIGKTGAVKIDYERTFNFLKLLGLTSISGILNVFMADAKDHSSNKYRTFLKMAELDADFQESACNGYTSGGSEKA